MSQVLFETIAIICNGFEPAKNKSCFEVILVDLY